MKSEICKDTYNGFHSNAPCAKWDPFYLGCPIEIYFSYLSMNSVNITQLFKKTCCLALNIFKTFGNKREQQTVDRVLQAPAVYLTFPDLSFPPEKRTLPLGCWPLALLNELLYESSWRAGKPIQKNKNKTNHRDDYPAVPRCMPGRLQTVLAV